ncbi:hypothetical protein [Spongiactinospora sp. TRM90649]|uniref:hypothetical protein n=1 Tax=Spongiactinospora sp. TRM90649 TaxID=3031114 RepID=UPI0023F6A541|nr:hypothetical protein [Spongiactinospora sp. TRM90649]MDF5755564.1 hypothetical protein [Spongiactinospora sp. TRM90649]
MGEFVGLDPSGAHELIRHMETSKGSLAATRPGLESAITRAEADWEGSGGVAAMHRAYAFLQDSQRDLKWRIDAITQIHAAPGAGDDLLTAKFPFASEEAATAAGLKAGTAVASAVKDHQATGTPDSWRAVESALKAGGAGVNDPAYAAALLGAIGGPAAFRTIFGQYMSATSSGPRRGLPPKEMAQAKSSLGPLAAAFAAADRTGRLASQWRKELLEKANPATLSAVVALARQSQSFRNLVATNLLKLPTAGYRADSVDRDWNTYWLLKSYESDPEGLQRLLAEQAEVPALLFDPDLAKATPEYGKTLSGLLDKALSENTGTAFTREAAWVNLIKGLGSAGSERLTGYFSTLENSPINRVLAKRLVPYLDELTLAQVHAKNPELGMGPQKPWTGLHPDVMARFLGAVIQNRTAMNTLQKGFRDHLLKIDIGKAYLFSTDSKERAEFIRSLTLAGAHANLLLGGSTYAELHHDEKAAFMAEVILLPIDFVLGKLPGGAALTTGAGYLGDRPKGELGEIIQDYFDKKTPDDAETVADRLVRAQLEWVQNSYAINGHPPFTNEELKLLRDALMGELSSALTDALKARGG